MDGRRRGLTQGSLPRTLIRMALPILGGMTLNSLYSLVDAFRLGKMRVGAREAPAAVGPTAALTFIVFAFGTGFGSGGTALVAQHTGAKRPREADRAAGQTLLLAFVADWGSLGIYCGMAGANVTAAVLAWRVFSIGNWARGVVPSRSEASDAATATSETTGT